MGSRPRGGTGHTLGAALLAATVGLGLSAPRLQKNGDSNFIEELACEEAVARLDGCCSTFETG